MPFGRLFSMHGSHIQSLSGPVWYPYHSRSVSRSELLRLPYCSRSVSRLELLRYSYLPSFGMDQARLTGHLSGAFTALLDVSHMLGELIDIDPGVHLLALLGRACWVICRCACHHLTWLTYRRSLSPLVDSCPGALAAASILNWWLDHMVQRSCTCGTVIVCGRGCDSGTVIPLLWKSLPRRRLISYGFVGNADWKGLIWGWFRGRFVVVNCHRMCVARDCRVRVGILLGCILGIVTSKQIWHCTRYCNRHCNLCRRVHDLVS